MRIYWTDDEGKWLAPDKGCHFILHAAIVRVGLCLGIHPVWAFLISVAWGVFYEIVFDCNVWVYLSKVILKKEYTGGMSMRDYVANTAGGILGLLL